ncbi:hypothetical protein QJS04_geneDACA001286 [Acorus gramineus]|uniref:Major facilitator superfamily (MFS) profile domain-containing protein n=1 Tax=Acorus gramineus TaxID=55184 RepID=A0AAV9ADJ9_ACOGR|nr:hypothetical protein QJS04_geneDACA001286 [Acorus gramineus]
MAITGIGTLMITPLVGSLSDEYGRKSLLTLPMTVAVLPLVVLASSRTRSSFFVYYAFKTLAGMVCEGSILCLSLAYVADNVGEGRRAAAFGILSGVSVAAFVLGTLIARLFPTTLTFQIAAITAAVAAVYMKAFLIDSNSGSGAIQAADPLKPEPCKRIPSVDDILCLLRRSLTFSQVAMVAFFSSLADSGLHASLLYYLKAQFHFNKDQFADLLLIVGVAGAFSQVPYVAATFGVMAVFIHPCMRSIVSKQVGATEQVFDRHVV